MQTRADSNKKFLLKYLLIAAAAFIILPWATYDIFVKGPKDIKKANIYWVQAEEDGKTIWKNRHSDASGEWTKIAKENNWEIGKPKKPPAAKGFIYYNYALFFICLIGGSIAAYKYLTTKNSWIEGNGERLTSSWGQEFAFQDVQSIDKTKWDNKGLARIIYRSDEGEKTFILDDLKYDRVATDDILYSIEQQLDDDQILNGSRELSPEARAKAKQIAEDKKKQLDVADDS